MTDKFKCKCGCEDFEISGIAHDEIVFLCNVDTEGNYDTTQSLKEYVGDTDWGNVIECYDCAKTYNLSEIASEKPAEKAVDIENGPHYKVWIEIEEYNPKTDEYLQLDSPFADTALFATVEEAQQFAIRLNDLGLQIRPELNRHSPAV